MTKNQSIYLLCKYDDLGNYGAFSVIGWHISKEFLESEAKRLEMAAHLAAMTRWEKEPSYGRPIHPDDRPRDLNYFVEESEQWDSARQEED